MNLTFLRFYNGGNLVYCVCLLVKLYKIDCKNKFFFFCFAGGSYSNKAMKNKPKGQKQNEKKKSLPFIIFLICLTKYLMDRSLNHTLEIAHVGFLPICLCHFAPSKKCSTGNWVATMQIGPNWSGLVESNLSNLSILRYCSISIEKVPAELDY